MASNGTLLAVGYFFTFLLIIIVSTSKNKQHENSHQNWDNLSREDLCKMDADFCLKPDLCSLPEGYEGNFNEDYMVQLEACKVQTDSHGSVWFLRSDTEMNWEEGKKFCENKGLKMARIYNTDENEAIFRMKLRSPNTPIYVGGSAPEGVSHSTPKEDYRKMFTWWNGDRVENIGWQVGSGEPNGPGSERYLTVAHGGHDPEGASQSWNDWGSHKTVVACEYRIFHEDLISWVDPTNLVDLEAAPVQTNSHGKVWFVRSGTKMNWENGKQFCENKGLKMARIYNSQENEAIYEMKLTSSSPILVGGSAPEGVSRSTPKEDYRKMFTWWNGDKVENIGWHVGSGEPNGPGSERYLTVFHGSASSHSWNDWGPHETYVACEYRILYNSDDAHQDNNQHGDCESDEAVSGHLEDGYRGFQTKTISGNTCQHWNDQTYHQHGFNVHTHESKGIGTHNYCRNPDHEPLGIWCYTTNRNVRWEYCDPLPCNNNNNNQEEPVYESGNQFELDQYELANPVGSSWGPVTNLESEIRLFWSSHDRIPAHTRNVEVFEPAESGYKMYLSWPDDVSSENHPGDSFVWRYYDSQHHMTCVLWDEPNDPDYWYDNGMCLPTDSPFEMKFLKNAGEIGGDGWILELDCINVNRPGQQDEETWHDNYFCVRRKQ